jgi:Uma2 family endonuclease
MTPAPISSVDSLDRDQEAIVYPESDGQPVAENTRQFEWIVTIKGGLDALFADNPDVFVAGDLLWYPVRGQPHIRRAPDAMVVFGRPKGHRGSYRQWEEANIAPQVVFEVLSPGNTAEELHDKFTFYTEHGVEEYYLYDPEHGDLQGYQRQGSTLQPISPMIGWVSPRLGIRFAYAAEDELILERPDGERFRSYLELEQERLQERREREAAQREYQQERREREAAQREYQQERREREAAQRKSERLAAKLRELGMDPDEVDL